MDKSVLTNLIFLQISPCCVANLIVVPEKYFPSKFNMAKSLNSIIFLSTVLFFTICVHSQFFHPILDDKSYLDNMEMDVKAEVEQSSAVLLREARLVEVATREYIGSKLKENVFKALRVLAEQEMQKLDESPKQRQDAEEGDSGAAEGASGGGDGGSSGGSDGGSDGGSESSEPATTELTGLGTAVKINQNVFKFIGDSLKIIFKGLGGKAKRLPKRYVDEASSLMDEPFADQLLGLVGLMANESQAEPTQPKIKFDESGVYNAMFHRGLERLNEAANSESETAVPNISRFNVDGFVASFKRSVEEVKDPQMLLDLYRGVRESYKFLDSMAHFDKQIRNARFNKD